MRDHFVAGYLIVAGLMASVARAGVAQTREDSAAVRAATRDYIMAWYEGDSSLMGRVLHPDLAKRSVRTDTSGKSRLMSTGTPQMVQMTGTRAKQAADQRMLDVTVLDLQPGMASAKAVSWDFIDYVHLARFDGRWVIINDLWTGRPK